MAAPVHLAVALDGTGFHPAAWREESARPNELFTARYWASLARVAEGGLLDFLTIEDSFGLQSSRRSGPDARTDQVRGRLDAVLIASLLGPVTTHIGLVPTAITTHTEPFHLASAFATLDYITRGRAGWRPRISTVPAEADHVGRRTLLPFDREHPDDPARIEQTMDLFAEAADVVEVARRLWDSWEDDAIIKDVATGRFVDRDKLHYVDFAGRFFSVKGPSIVPRPPQGNPIVAALAHSQVPLEFAARSADIVFVTPADCDDVPHWLDQVSAAEAAVDRPGAPLKRFADLVVFLDESTDRAQQRKERLDALDGREYRSDAAVFVGTPDDLADELLEWRAHGLDGFQLRPGVIDHDLALIATKVATALQRRGAFRSRYAETSLRERLGLPRLPSRYATAGRATTDGAR